MAVSRGSPASHASSSARQPSRRRPRGGDKGKSRVRCAAASKAIATADAQALVLANVAPGSPVNTDSASVFRNLASDYVHGIVNHHASEWVRGDVHTKGIENFWGLLKRTVRGTYVFPSPSHTFRYLDEQAFRFNERHMTDAERFNLALRSVGLKRLTYAALTGASVDRRRA